METIWTVAGDESSWPEWVKHLAASSASETVRQFASGLRPGSLGWAIDLGCGTGRSFLPLVDNGYQVVGIDPIWEAVTVSKARVEKGDLAAYPVLASASRLPIRNEGVQAVFAISTLFHLHPEELEDALFETRRVLMVGGEAVLHFLGIGDWRKTLGEESQVEDIPKPGFRAVVTGFFQEEAIRTMLQNAGLTIRGGFRKVSQDNEGERIDWFFQCVRQE